MNSSTSGRGVVLRRGGEMPIIGFGTWRLEGEVARAAVLRALEVGYRHIDTATMYQNEKEVGLAAIDSGLRREELFITTKILSDAPSVRGTIEKSLADLQTDYVDLWLIHWPPGDRGTSRALYREMLAVRDLGLARAIGVSNYAVAEIDDLTAATGEASEVNQVPWSPYLYDPSLQRELDERGIVLEGYSPFRRSQLDDPVLVAIAAEKGVTPAQVVLRWHVEHGVVAIPRSHQPDRIAGNFEVFGFSLGAESMQRLDALSSH